MLSIITYYSTKELKVEELEKASKEKVCDQSQEDLGSNPKFVIHAY